MPSNNQQQEPVQLEEWIVTYSSNICILSSGISGNTQNIVLALQSETPIDREYILSARMQIEELRKNLNALEQELRVMS